jgi:hypothetical protein
MASQLFNPPWEYLRLASKSSLQSYELTRLNHAANLRKEIGVLLDEWIEHSACALPARWLLDHQTQLHASKFLEGLPDPQRDLFAETENSIRAKKSR